MNNPMRYSPIIVGSGYSDDQYDCAIMDFDDEGGWVSYSDYDNMRLTLEKRVVFLKNVLEEYKRMVEL